MKKEREEKNKEEYNFFALDKGYDANRFQIGPRVSADDNNRRESHRFLYIFVSIGLILLLVSGFFIVNNSKETKTEGIGYVISNFGETSKGVIVKAVDFIMDSFSKITGNVVYQYSPASVCGNGIIENSSIYISSNNVKNSSKYSAREVFFISDKNWKDVLSLVPVTTWIGNETWCKRGYMLNSNVCIYPSLVFHEVEEINRINLNNFYRAIDDAITMGYTNETYPTETLTTKSQSWSYPCGQADAEPRLYLMRPWVNTTLLNVGDYFSMNISIANCDTQKSHNITSLKVYFNQLEDHMTSYNITFNGADGVVAPGATKKIIIQLQFLSSLPSAIDADSAIYFMQQYAPINITIVGNTTEELDSLLVAPTPIGANIEQNNTERITIDDYFSFWQNYDALVYSEEDYETAMLSATYASLHNLPLVIENTSLESSNIFSGKNVICVGNVSYTGLSCASQFSLEQLRHKYFDETNTNKLILIRPNDLNSSVNENFIPKKTANAVYEIYDKVSLGAAFLASAKKELIVSTKDNYFYDTDRTLKNWLRQFYNTTKVNIYLTIMAKPASISFRDILFNSYLGGSTTLSLDGNLYGDTNNDGVVDLYVGRIAGITSTDVFSYLARDLFYNSLYRPNNMSFLSSSFEYMKYLSGNISQDFRNGGYNSYTYWTSWPINAYFNKTLVSYMDHGGPEHSGLSYSNIPELSNTLNFEFSCASCYALGANSRSYCANIIRRGSIFYLGGVDTDYTGNQWIHVSIMNEIYYRNKTLGQAFRDACVDMKRNSYVTTMLADPTFYPNPQFKLKSPLEQSY